VTKGVGIAEKHLSRIFDPYFSTKEMGLQKGMGLGLTTAYSIINRHDGYLTVDSEVGVGTTFTINLPAPENEISGPEPIGVITPEEPSAHTGRILLMDDEEMIRDLGHRILSRLEYDTELAADGNEAIEMYQKAMDAGKPFEIVILDLTVKGGLGGKDAAKKILKINPQAKVIVSSGYSDDPVITKFREYGFIGALPKPYNIKDLINALNKATT
jgi:CheY-like chemotaxis protein